MSEIEIGLRVFWLCLTFGFLTFLMAVVSIWSISEDKEEDERIRKKQRRVGKIE